MPEETKSRRRNATSLVVGGTLIAILGVWFAVLRRSPETRRAVEAPLTENAVDSKESIPTSASQVLRMYADIPATADEFFKGKWLQINELVSHTEKKPSGETYISFGGDIGGTVQCFFKPNREAELAGVVSGRLVIVHGRCEGKQGKNVVLRDCSVVGK